MSFIAENNDTRRSIVSRFLGILREIGKSHCHDHNQRENDKEKDIPFYDGPENSEDYHVYPIVVVVAQVTVA